MMDYFTKNKTLFWCVIILVIVNVITLGSFWIKKPLLKDYNPSPDGGKIMEERLQLSQEQARQFDQIRNQHFKRTNPLQDDMHKLRMDLLDELFSPDSDKTKIQKLLDELADKQKTFNENLYRHFYELKQACNDQPQVKELNIMLKSLIESTRTRGHARPPHPRRLGDFAPGHSPPPR